MDLDKDIERLVYLNQKITKVIKKGKDLDSGKYSSLVDECKSLRDKLEQVASNFVDTNDLSELDKVINVLHSTGAVLAEVEKDGIKSPSDDIEDDGSDDADAFARIQFSSSKPKPVDSDSDVNDTGKHGKSKHDKSSRKSGRKSIDSSSLASPEPSEHGLDEPFEFEADFTQFSFDNNKSTSGSIKQKKNKDVDKSNIEQALKEAIDTINDYKAYISTLEELIKDLALGDLRLNPNDKARFLEINRDSKTFIDNLGSSLGISLHRPSTIINDNPPLLAISQGINIPNSESLELSTLSAPAPVFYLRRKNLTCKMSFVDPILLSNYFGQHLCKPDQELFRFGNLFSLTLTGGFTELTYSYKVSIKCLTQSMDIFMSLLNSPSINRPTVSQYMSKNSFAEIRDFLDLTHGPFPLLNLSIVQSDGFACKFNITLPVGPFLTMTSNFLSTREFDTLWRSPIYTNSKFSVYEISILCFESKSPLPMIDVLYEDIKVALTLNGILNVTSVGELAQCATYQITSTIATGFLKLYNIDARLFRDCSNTCLMGKVTVKCGRNKLNIKLELKSIIHLLLISTRDCLKESLSMMLTSRTRPNESKQSITMDRDITFPLPFEDPINEVIDFKTAY